MSATNATNATSGTSATSASVERVERLEDQLFVQPEEHVYAALDAARDPAIYPAVIASGVAHVCLYAGSLSPTLAAVAPYLVRLRRGHPFTREILEQWGKAWGIFLTSDGDLETMRRHLRRVLRVETEDKRKLLFRYYDPRVLRVYVPTCTNEELETFFGPIGAFVVEADPPSAALVFARRGGVASMSYVEVAQREPVHATPELEAHA